MTPEAARTIINLHMKRCPKCKYDLSTHTGAICPECGLDLIAAAAHWTSDQTIHRHRAQTIMVSLLPNLAVFAWPLVQSRRDAMWAVPLMLFAFISVPAAGVWLLLFTTVSKRSFETLDTALGFIIAAWLWPILVFTLFFVL